MIKPLKLRPTLAIIEGFTRTVPPPGLLRYLKDVGNPKYAYLIDQGNGLVEIKFTDQELNYPKLGYYLLYRKDTKKQTLVIRFPRDYDGRYYKAYTPDSIILSKKTVIKKRKYIRKSALVIEHFAEELKPLKPDYDLLIIADKKKSKEKKRLINKTMLVTEYNTGDRIYYYIKILDKNKTILKRVAHEFSKDGVLELNLKKLERFYGVKLGKIVSVQDYGDEISLLYDTREESKKYVLRVKYDGYWVVTVDEMMNLITLVRFPTVADSSQ
ncbi:hypothetical protein [Sulfolobus tengchongensis spindle-shaped virus 3]|nr:hypothetical protein [Sulfolobus tengchongensis spindle-shaped virus 3]